ncbi:MAG: MlaD family protein [Bdellovibrionales bacterium]
MKKILSKQVHAFKTGWYLWLFPAVALAVSGWFLYDYYAQVGPRIRIHFEDAGSIQPEKTTVRFRGVVIGTVQDVHISDDQKEVIADVLLRQDAKDFAVEGSKFYLVKPKVNFQGISGLETLIDGTFISVVPGSGEPKANFKAQSSPTNEIADDMSSFIIETPSTESISTGDSITYRGMRVGTVGKMHFPKGAQNVNVQINIENRYTYLIRNNTAFWRKVGIQAKLGLFGSDIKVNSMDSIMNGGIEFATPTQAAPRAKAMQKFTLLAAMPKDVVKWSPALE